MLTMLDSYAGTGAATIAGDKLGIRTTQFIEIDSSAQRVLSYRFPKIPIHPDIRTYQGQFKRHNIHWVSFPCTGTSNAGKREGLNHPESKMFFYSLRAIAVEQPEFVVIEQPRGIINNGLRAVLGGLRMVEYSYEDPEIISASELGAPHERERVFVIAYPHDLPQRFGKLPTGWDEQIRAEIEAIHQPGGQVTPNGFGLDDGVPDWLGGVPISGHWRDTISATPTYPGTGHHIKNRRHCIDLYGRAVTPQQAEIVLKRVCYLAELAGVGSFSNHDKHRQSNHDN
ncbi:DNA cytosine methyltransferase [Anabaena cylindrica FACHB-243]|nr:DNA cytosine methyltransferase [Anabaena cylindrica FACHB-243]MBY5284490.1 DNA cytosine methyltransferase [Anabaena sp. CCAP 1446/1C]MBY5306763.1 DNA cytosine methyltransferase [Anabaena sp. CCAP 1446/1C]